MSEFLSYTFGDLIPVSTPNIEYGILELDNIQLREVFKDGEPDYVYHIAIKGVEVPSQHYIDEISKVLRCECDHIDPTYSIKFEYSLYAIVEDVMIRESIMDMLNLLDEKIGELKCES